MDKERDQGKSSWLPALTRCRFVRAAGAIAALGTTSLNSLVAWTVDAARRAGDSYCYNCALSAGTNGDAWAGCSIFPGKTVAGRGWCSAWSAVE